MLRLQKFTARVFVSSSKKSLTISERKNRVDVGGNPITIFSSAPSSMENGSYCNISSSMMESLAQSCSWESVIITSPPLNSKNDDFPTIFNSSSNNYILPRFRFFAPSGKELSFCLHAAMGAAYVLHHQQQKQELAKEMMSEYDGITNDDKISFTTVTRDNEKFFTARIISNDKATKNNDDETDMVWLDLNCVPFKEESVNMIQIDALLDQVNLETDQVSSTRNKPPMNAGILGRPKTMVQLSSMNDLQITTQNPRDSSQYQSNCFEANNSTGLYLYSPATNDDGGDVSIKSYECRQFPKESGYPEDPATGIAAAALAVHLSSSKNEEEFEFKQGTSMGRPSSITIRNILRHSKEEVSLQCGGNVILDKEEKIVVY